MSSIIPDIELPILIVDEVHWQKVSANGAAALEYSVSNKDGFQLSTQGFEFPLPAEVEISGPNIIQIIVGKEQLYATAYERGMTLFTINKTNLVPMYGSRPFAGFQKDAKIIVAIGHLAPPTPELPQPKFTVLWVGVVNIL